MSENERIEPKVDATPVDEHQTMKDTPGASEAHTVPNEPQDKKKVTKERKEISRQYEILAKERSMLDDRHEKLEQSLKNHETDLKELAQHRKTGSKIYRLGSAAFNIALGFAAYYLPQYFEEREKQTPTRIATEKMEEAAKVYEKSEQTGQYYLCVKKTYAETFGQVSKDNPQADPQTLVENFVEAVRPNVKGCIKPQGDKPFTQGQADALSKGIVNAANELRL